MAGCLGGTNGIVQLAWCDEVHQERYNHGLWSTTVHTEGNDLKFDCKAVQDFANRFNIQWKCTSTYNPQGSGVVERMVGNLKKALQKVTRSESKKWDQSLANLLYGYRRRPGTEGIAPFEISFGVQPRFSIELSVCTPGAKVLSHARPFELALALINLAERLVPRSLQKEAHCQVGDKVLLRCGKKPEGSKFETRMWMGPFKVISVEHPRYMLENAPGRKSSKPVHFRRLRRYEEQYEQHSDGGKNCKADLL